MKSTLAGGLGGLVLGLSIAHAAPAGSPSVDWPIGDLLANPDAKAVLQKDLPGLLAYPGLASIGRLTIRRISAVPQAKIDAAKLAAIEADLAAVKVKG